MVGRTKLLDENTLKIANDNLKKLGRYGMLATKLRAIIAAGEHGIAPVARVYGIARSTLTDWIKNIKKDVEELNIAAGRGRKSKLDVEQYKLIESWLTNDLGLTIDKVKALILEHFNLDLGRSTVHRIMQKLSYRYITPRPIHYKQDELKQLEFKKKDKGSNS